MSHNSWPTSLLPVKQSASTFASASRRPVAEPPQSTWKLDSGHPTLANALASSADAKGVDSAGFQMSEFPIAKAGPAYSTGMLIGKFHGVIAATTPSPIRSTSACVSGVTIGNSSGSIFRT